MAFNLGGGQIGTAWIISDTSVFKNGRFATAARHVSRRLSFVMLADIMAAQTHADQLFTHAVVT